MALSRYEVDRFMVGGKSQKDAAAYFGVTTRYIRRILATPPAVSSSVLAVGLADAPGAVDWVRVPGERGLHRVVVAPHNESEQLAKAEQPVPVPIGTTLFPPPAPPVTPHNAMTVAYPLRVVARAVPVQSAQVVDWFLGASLGPLPLPAVLVALLLIVICGVL
jgi:hypothetical protein